MDIKDEAKKDWQSGMKYKDIANKYEVSLSTIKSWATRYWKKEAEKVATKSTKKLQPNKEKLQPKQKGNVGGAPRGNTNHLIHGAYRNIYADTLTQKEQEIFESVSCESVEEQLVDQIKLLSVREYRLLERIKYYNELAKETKGLIINNVNKEKQSVDFTDKETYIKLQKKGTVNITQTNTINVIEIIAKLENELTKVQSKKIKCIVDLAKIRQDIKLDIPISNPFSEFTTEELKEILIGDIN